jgi:ADP-ribose pyrophosphatase YjhB (NUDIX family)
MEKEQMTNWEQSVTGVVLKDGKVLLARHTYGVGKGLFIVPGGYVEKGERPEDAVIREYKEETGVTVQPHQILAIRFNPHDWYIAFSATYIEGTPVSDGDENDAVVWMDIEEALAREDVPDLTKKLIECARQAALDQSGLKPITYSSRSEQPGSLYGI